MATPAKQIDTSKITLTAPAAVGKSGMKIHKVSYANKPLNILLTDELTCPFQPSAYRGNGIEERLGIVMKAPDDLYQVFAGIEARCRGLLHLDNFEKLEELWCPTARSNEFGQTLRANINVCGDNACDFWNAEDERTGPPDDIRIVSFQAMCLVRGVYTMKTSFGFIIDVTTMKYEEKSAAQVEHFFSIAPRATR